MLRLKFHVVSLFKKFASKLHLSIQASLYVFGLIFLSGLLGASAIVLQTVNEHRIGSPEYQSIIDSKDLVADILPPPLLPYQAVLLMNSTLMMDKADTAGPISDIQDLGKQYKDRVQFWKETMTKNGKANLPQWAAFLKLLEDKGGQFWSDMDQKVIPAIKSGDAYKTQIIADEDAEFKSFEHSIVAALDFIQSENTKLVDSSLERTQAGLMQMSIIGGGTVVLTILAIFLLQKRVIGAIRRTSSVMGALAQGDRDVTVPFRHRRDEVGEMARALEVFKTQAEMIQVNKEQNENVITQMGMALRELASGNLTYQLEEPFADKLDDLRVSFNEAVAALQGVIASVKSGTDGIRFGAEEISSASDDLSRRTENQAANLEETAAAVAEITSKVRQTASGATQARRVVESAKADSDKGGEIVRQAVDAMRQIESSSKKITQIISLIDEIAFQTNLLALNAGVEAARAGDAGRGFAVVASEVRALAQRSADAAKEIKGILTTSEQAVGQGVQLVAATGNSLRSIIDRITEINKVITEIASSAEQQSSGLQEVNSAVGQMDEVTQQNAAMVEKTNAATRTLNDQSVELARLVAKFVVSAQDTQSEAAAA